MKLYAFPPELVAFAMNVKHSLLKGSIITNINCFILVIVNQDNSSHLQNLHMILNLAWGVSSSNDTISVMIQFLVI